jgi:hypothetical protein
MNNFFFQGRSVDVRGILLALRAALRAGAEWQTLISEFGFS